MMFPGWGMGGSMMATYGFAVLILVGIVVGLSRCHAEHGEAGSQRQSCWPNATPAERSMTTSTSSD